MDVDEAKIELLSGGGSLPIHEPGLDRARRQEPRAAAPSRPSMDEALEAAELLFCCVDTPPTYSGDADLSRVQAVVAKLPEDCEHALVMKSTVPSGTGARSSATKPELAYVSCPEFLKEGSAVEGLHAPRPRRGRRRRRATSGPPRRSRRLYEPLGGEIVRTDVAWAEMIKLASNAFLATKISFINEIANVCEAGRRRRHRGRARDGPGRADRAELPARGDWLSAALAFARTRPPSSSSPATPATTSSCSPR